MGQITEAFSKLMLERAREGKLTPLTAWEQAQFASAWLKLAAAPQPAQAGASGGGGYQRAWEHIAENSYDHNTPGMICIPTEEWKAAEAMFTADKGGSNG